MATQWQTANSVWQENDASGHFELVSTRGLGPVTLHASRLADAAQCLGAALPASCHCSPIYPEEFAFCPTCGKALQSTSTNNANNNPANHPTPPAWYGPWADHGLPEHAAKGLGQCGINLNPGAPQQNTRPNASMPAPPSGRCVFASAHFGFAAPRLLALDYRQNVLQYWDPTAQDWQLLAGNGTDLTFTASDYYWLRPLDDEPGSVAVLPTAQGLMQLRINPLNLSYRLQPLLQQTLVSAPGRVFNYLACLYQRDGALLLFAQNIDTEMSSNFPCSLPAHSGGIDSASDGVPDPDQADDAPEASATTDQAAPPQHSGTPLHGEGGIEWLAGWSRPIAFQGKLIWLHALGQLIWQPGNPPKMLPWPAGWQARNQGASSLAPAMQSRDGRLWMLGQNAQGDSFVEIGSGTPQLEACDGVRLGFANFMFRLGHPLRAEPWESFTVEDEND
ncbi:MAG: hypothetical protein RL748_2638, partial [Pseudomonadota bacterium]